VINLAAETKYGQSEEVYQQKVVDVAVKIGTAAKEHNVPKFIEVSTAGVYKAGKGAKNEASKPKPWTKLASAKLVAEQKLKELGLPLVILRPAIVYGPGDVLGISPRVITAAVYKKLGEKMKFLWSGSLQINTVHVVDVARAIWIAFEKGKVGETYNLVDHNTTTQESVNTILEEIFGIETGFVGTALSNLAKANMSGATEDINEKHLAPWADLCKEHGILSTPLTPYLDQELLYNNSLSVDGTKFETEMGFEYTYPKMTTELIREQIDYFLEQDLFPNLWN